MVSILDSDHIDNVWGKILLSNDSNEKGGTCL